MANTIEIGLVQLLVSHLCHELVSPIGAINNGVELLEELGPASGSEEVVNLIGQSGRNGAAKLRCYRLAYGLAGANAGVPGREARAVATELLSSEGRVQLQWPDGAVAEEYGPRSIQLVLNLVLLAVEFLPRGGTITVSAESLGDAEAVTVSAQGAVVKIDPRIADILHGKSETADHRSIHAAFCYRLAGAAGLPLSLIELEDGVVLTTQLPLAAPAAA
ncbi:histidine phosphotransferase family protein [Lacibacterium aquatile]|uniref:Histidine phosphotransferase family protein n=1 Tax=Lacibacterium aquatile TaxID=1168082 RepID=A0ABW5DQB4_9PROT